MCRLFTSELNHWFTHMPGMRPNLTCSKVAPAFIGYGEESDTPLFRHLKILSIAQRIDGDSAQVTVKARFDYKHFPKPVHTVFADRLHLVKRGGLWDPVDPLRADLQHGAPLVFNRERARQVQVASATERRHGRPEGTHTRL